MHEKVELLTEQFLIIQTQPTPNSVQGESKVPRRDSALEPSRQIGSESRVRFHESLNEVWGSEILEVQIDAEFQNDFFYVNESYSSNKIFDCSHIIFSLSPEQLYADNVKNRLVHRDGLSNVDEPLQFEDRCHEPLDRYDVHLYACMNFPACIFSTCKHLLRFHKQFAHPTTEKL